MPLLVVPIHWQSLVHNTRHAISADNEVVMDANVERPARVDNVLRDFDIISARLRAARRMIVRQDQRRGVMQ